VKNVQTVQNRPNNDHDYDFPSLKVAHAGNMQKNMPHICGICSIIICMPHICATYFTKFYIFSRIYCLKKFRTF